MHVHTNRHTQAQTQNPFWYFLIPAKFALLESPCHSCLLNLPGLFEVKMIKLKKKQQQKT